MNKYVYRASVGYIPGNDIISKDPTDTTKDLAYHIGYGSNAKTSFISCTKNMGVAQKYSKKSKRYYGTPCPVVLVDLTKLEKYPEFEIYDILDPEIIKKHNLDRGNAAKFGPASQEVVVKKIIPAECITQIPLLFQDILRGLECCKFDYHNILYDNSYEIIIQTVKELIAKGDNSILELIDTSNLSGLEQEFIKQYYYSHNEEDEKSVDSTFGKSLSQIADSMLPNTIEESERLKLIECIRLQTIKNIVGTNTFRSKIIECIENNIDEIQEEYSEKDILLLQKLLNTNSNLIETFYEGFDPDIKLTANNEYKKAYKHCKTNSDPFLFVGDSVCIKYSDSKEIPYGAQIISKGNNEYEVTPSFLRLVKNEVNKVEIEYAANNNDYNEYHYSVPYSVCIPISKYRSHDLD